MKKAVLCADIGTSSVKAAFISVDGEIFAIDKAKIEKADESNRWLFAFKKVVSLLIAQIEQKASKSESITLIGISISGAGPSFANSQGSFLWNSQIESDFAKSMPQRAIGSIFLPRIFYIQQKLSKLLQNGEPLFLVPEYLIYQLTGKAFTLLPNERYKKAYWDKERLFALNIDKAILPPFIEMGKSFGTITQEKCKFLGIEKLVGNAHLPTVFCGGPDFAIALIGTATLIPGKICDRAGTSEGLNLCTNMPLADKSVRTLPSPLEPLWNESVIIADSGYKFSAWKKQSIYNEVSYEECVESLLNDKKSDGYKLMLEIAFDVKKAVETLQNLAKRFDVPFDNKICCTGGQAKNKSWLKMKSEIVGVPFYTLHCNDAELLGNAAVALYGLGFYASIFDAAQKFAHVK